MDLRFFLVLGTRWASTWLIAVSFFMGQAWAENPSPCPPEPSVEDMPYMSLILLDKITGRTIKRRKAVGRIIVFGPLLITLKKCKKRYPGEDAAARLIVHERGSDLQLKEIFSGWMFNKKPGISTLEHPMYDVWLEDCGPKAWLRRL